MLGLAKVTRGPRWPCIAHLITSQVSSQLAFSVQEKKFNINFQDGRHLGFPIRMILATFDPQVTCNEVLISWLFGSEEKVQNRFSTWRRGRLSWISKWNNSSYF